MGLTVRKIKFLKIAKQIPVFLAFAIASCGDGLNLFTVENDAELGAQFDNEILSDSATYPVVSEADYPEAYGFLENIRDQIVASGRVGLSENFDWPVRIIADDSTLNAFSTPGGYTYYYTGLMKFLDTADDLAGVMAHEIAHADKRHVTESLTREYGLDLLLAIVLGEESQNAIVSLSRDLSSLSFSRDAESEADEASVEYLSETEFACDAAASFFQKLIEEGLASSPPEFLSTHPNPENRVEAIGSKAAEEGCDTTPSGSEEDYDAFKNSLP